MIRHLLARPFPLGLLLTLMVASAAAQSTAAQAPAAAEGTAQGQAPPQDPTGPAAPVLPQGVPLPPDYVIGPEDVLTVVFWRDKDMTAEASVRPDGRITLPLVNDIDAAGLTPEQLSERIEESAKEFIEAPTVTVVVKQINSRRVFITGMVSKPGAYPLTTPTSVLQLISIAGGLQEFADSDSIMIMRTENGQQKALKFNYKDVRRGRNLDQNILLKPGDTVVVP